MQTTVTQLPKSSVELSVEVSVEKMKPYLVRAAESLSREHKVPGFRPGKLPYDMAVQQFGSMAIYEEAVDQAVRDMYVRAVREQNIKTVGSPQINVTKLAPENPLVFTATVAILPNVTLPDFTTITIGKRVVKIAKEDTDRVMNDLRKMQPKEILVDRAAEKTDKVIVDLDLTRERVPIDGGQARDHHIYLNEDYYFPSVREALIGMKKGDVKEFPIEFPKDHTQKLLAGTIVDAKVAVKDVYSVELPELDDTFAKALGQTDIPALRTIVEGNLKDEATKKANDAEEIEMLDATIAKAKIDELPEILITGEAHRMIDELEHGVQRQGLTFDEYLKSIKKTRDQIFLDMAPEAVKRVKIALLTRAVADHAKVEVDDAEVDAEVQAQLKRYENEPEFKDRIQSEEAREYVRATLRNRKVIQWLREHVQWKDAK